MCFSAFKKALPARLLVGRPPFAHSAVTSGQQSSEFNLVALSHFRNRITQCPMTFQLSSCLQTCFYAFQLNNCNDFLSLRAIIEPRNIHASCLFVPQRPTAKELLKHKFIVKNSKKTSYLTELIDRFKRWKAEGHSDDESDSEGSDSYVQIIQFLCRQHILILQHLLTTIQYAFPSIKYKLCSRV